jgi:hypothetical protein
MRRKTAVSISRLCGGLSIPGLLAAAETVTADVGEVEIRPLCVSSGCFAGDTPAWPVQITQSGRYVLTGDLEVPSANDDAIAVGASNVHIDLNGFSLIGPVVCSAGVVSCSRSGSGVGILGTILGRGIVIENGVITGFGSDAIRFNAAPLTIQDVDLYSNGGDGVDAASGGTFSRLDITANGGDGVRTSSDLAFTLDSRIVHNGGVGIGAGVCGNNLLGLNDDVEELCGVQISNNTCNGTLCP